MRTAPSGGDVVKSSAMKSEHIVPSHNIKDIIRQYQTPPPAPQELRRSTHTHTHTHTYTVPSAIIGTPSEYEQNRLIKKYVFAVYPLGLSLKLFTKILPFH